jgi:transposase
MWIEFYSKKDVEKFLTIIIKTLGKQIHKKPEADDWFPYRILGIDGDERSGWRYESHPNLLPMKPTQKSIYSRNIDDCKVELSISVRFPRRDAVIALNIINEFLLNKRTKVEELSDAQWNKVKRYLPPQPLSSRKRINDRNIINGIRYQQKTGCSFSGVPRKYGSTSTIRRRIKEWSVEGVLETILKSFDEEGPRGGLNSHSRDEKNASIPVTNQMGSEFSPPNRSGTVRSVLSTPTS